MFRKRQLSLLTSRSYVNFNPTKQVLLIADVFTLGWDVYALSQYKISTTKRKRFENSAQRPIRSVVGSLQGSWFGLLR